MELPSLFQFRYNVCSRNVALRDVAITSLIFKALFKIRSSVVALCEKDRHVKEISCAIKMLKIMSLMGWDTCLSLMPF